MSGDLEDIKLDSETDIEPEHGGQGSLVASSGDEAHGQSKSTAAATARGRDQSNYSLVEAAQYGLLQRCHDLIENEGADVTQGDEENITPLHWAAINNRIPVASYFLQKGADINAIGGELKSTPIHWAARQGHLSMVVHLMRYGARPEILDGEGINCLHIAAQFGFNKIMAYLISYRTPLYIDCLDSQGRTPLMHAATRAAKSFDTTRLLVSLGANIRALDKKNMTALHYSATNLNYAATKVLLDSNAPVDIKNNDGKTPYDLAVENKNTYDAEMILLAQQKTNPQGIREHLTRNPRFCWWVLFLFPILLLFVIGWIGLICPNWWTYLIIISSQGFVVRLWLTTYLPVHPENPPVAFGLVIGTKLLIYVTALYYGIPTGVIVHWVWLHILLVVTLVVFYRTTLSDPGHIPKITNPEQARRAIADLCERGLFVESNYCTTCLVRRPLRSKHCAACDRCVARFDHHCPWVNNCIGVRNHKIFLFYLVCLLFMLTWGAKASVTYVYQFHLATHGNFIVRMYHYITAQPWIGYIMITCFIHLTWVYLLLLAQLFQMVCQGVTTNEMRNRHRYEHFQKFDGANPFHRGIIANCLDLFGFTCCQDRASQVDWTKTYDIPKSFNNAVKKIDEKIHQSTIPLPFSSTWNPSKDKLSEAKRFSRGRRANGYLSSDDDGGMPQQQQFTAHQEFQI